MTAGSILEPRIDVHFHPDEFGPALASDVRSGLTADPKTLPPKWFYDDVGSALFDEITRLPEYYPTECERQILRDRAGTIAAVSGADTLVELGSGTSDKTRVLLDAMADAGTLERYVPFDVAEGTLREAADMIASRYPGVVVHGVVGDFERHLDRIPGGGRRVFALLGGTVGNFTPAERRRLLGQIAATMAPGDSFVLGTDLVKDRRRLVAAYDDAAGVTAAFNVNVLSVLNRELGADFDPDAFEHVARFDDHHEWIEMRLRSKADQTVRVADLDLVVHFDAGEELRTEISAKFRRSGVVDELASVGLDLACWWTDEAGDYALSLSRRPDPAG